RLYFGVQVLPRHIQGDPCLFGKALELGKQGTIFRFGPGLYGPFVEGFALVGDDKVEVKVDGVAEALASRTSAVGVIEREQPRFGLIVAAAVVLTLKALREAEAFGFFPVARSPFEHDLAGFAVADFYGVDDSCAGVGRDHNAIDQCENRLGEIDFQQGFRSGEFEDLSVLKETVEAPLAEIEKPTLDGVR